MILGRFRDVKAERTQSHPKVVWNLKEIFERCVCVCVNDVGDC